MKKMCVVGLAMLVLLGGVVSSAIAAPYASGSFGMVSLNDSTFSAGGGSAEVSFDTGFGFMAAIGNNFEGLRGEVELSYRTNDADKISAGGFSESVSGDFSSTAVMGNLLVDLPLSESVRPFLGAGIGLANVDADGDEDDTVFAYQAIVGAGFPLTHVTTLDLQYRYFATEDPNFNGIEAEYQTHNFFAGLRFDF
jgi:opacity protein-like surface antigen